MINKLIKGFQKHFYQIIFLFFFGNFFIFLSFKKNN